MSVSGIDFLWWKLHALTDSADISTITIENMPGGTHLDVNKLYMFSSKPFYIIC